ncbi:ABC transporter, periplasmic substrate-binding protein, aliphatic sulfonates [Citrifermentans bemidjiense Bem]|uniref:ABC transporter, periplasmic substrate-binding protein, aliphatic sulfonates n=1 Tax=Citrifermentans bemidjiense (strain ATCC BAA-1014 / DSM 16622 / JCM 12645 / Bem) TaxID=404380 RepID=B5EA45_CITBB|nr:ABC transporter substrate-binding protein [Citrifermentans bemidjiense]ACH38751.1 ABC transporter, periplasmic substrate-binding protein, aliphatic sulfonates [Citrifermentans bemidjiense Bem]
MNRREFIKTTGLALAAAAVPGFAFAGGAKVNIKVGYLPITDHLLMIASEREQFKSVGIQPVKFSSWPEISEALKVGAIDAAFLLTPIGLTLRQKGVPVKVVLLGHRNGSAITVKNSSEINRIEDLKGKTIAVPSPFSTHNLLLRKVLTERHLDPNKDLKIIDMAPPEMVNALATGRIEGYIVAEPFGAQAEAQKVGKVLMLSKDIWHDHICCVLNVRESVIAKYPEAVQEMVAGFLRTASFIETSPVLAAKGSTKVLGQRPEIVERVLTSPRDRLSFQNLVPNKKDFAATQDYMIKFGVAKQKTDLAGYLDDRFARKAV